MEKTNLNRHVVFYTDFQVRKLAKDQFSMAEILHFSIEVDAEFSE